MRNILIFYGPSKEFKSHLSNDENTLSLYKMLDYTKLIDSKEDFNDIMESQYESIIIYSADYAGLSDSGEKGLHHILKYFIELFDIQRIYLQNPTKVIESNISLMVENNDEFTVRIVNYEYPALTKRDLVNVFRDFSNRIIGQDKTKADIMSALYTLYKNRNDNKPLVLMFYGPSGVGKTETAKFISEITEGSEPIRTQVSMFQNQNSVNYLFGENHDANSFALDLLNRKTNVILLDEFDKTFGVVYSAFYQMFDEGVFEDRNYSVDLKDTIIICTSNYQSANSIRESIGDPLFFRFNKLVKFQSLSRNSILKIMDLVYKEIIEKFDANEKLILANYNLLNYLKSNVERFMNNGASNYRYIKNTIDDLISSILVKELVLEEQGALEDSKSSVKLKTESDISL